ncbi:DUF6115 domain-containing protein [Alteribacter populi]|uniref:DUF6115 domain-containing protein n=1 Tax=Alteribacter populi TaxID=2011011 RepID=UPI000BBB4986|nr:DUF6115 domain-containing protein [Alteribacter populi]
MVYFLIVSIVLHFISFYFLILLYQKQQNISYSEKKHKQTVQEIEDLLVAYTAEMKDSNEKLINELVEKQHETQAANPRNSDYKTEELGKEKQQSENIRPHINPFPEPEVVILETEQNYSPPVPKDEPEESVEASQTAQVLSLYHQGYSELDIAKKLNIGNGEVQLLLKFYK